MPKFNVYGVVTGSKYLGEFEAANKEEAERIAISKSSISLCHHCSGECEDAEIGDVTAEPVDARQAMIAKFLSHPTAMDEITKSVGSDDMVVGGEFDCDGDE